MARPKTSPLLANAIQRLVRAMHAAYPQITTEGVQPKMPGLFIGKIGGKDVRLVPGARNSRLFIDAQRATGRMTYFRYAFDLLKKGVTPRSGSENDDETRLVLWLTTAAIELEGKVSK